MYILLFQDDTNKYPKYVTEILKEGFFSALVC